MLDFLKIEREFYPRKKAVEIYPNFIVSNVKDLMIRGGDFYAIWDEARNRWSTDEFDAFKLIDNELRKYAEEYKKSDSYKDNEYHVRVMYASNSLSGTVEKWHKYVQNQMPDLYVPLDSTLVFSNEEVTREKYASKTLPYPLEEGSIDAYEELISTLYAPEERMKIEWAIGAIITGDSKWLQKFLVLYGASGTGKSTILNVIQMLFEGYWASFDAKILGQNNAAFALEAFKANPLVAIQHDGDLSKIEDNTRLNSIVSHETMTVNEKYKSAYDTSFHSFLFMGTNRPVKITDAKSGILRRLIDVSPTGMTIPNAKYLALTSKIKFELGAIAYHCVQVYRDNIHKYDRYVTTTMLGESNDFYNFIMDNFEFFMENRVQLSLTTAWKRYKEYCEETNALYQLSRRVFKAELRNYYSDYKDRYAVEDDNGGRKWYRCVFFDFIEDKFSGENLSYVKDEDDMEFIEQDSILDDVLAEEPAQYAKKDGTPKYKWETVETTLKELDTHKLHYVRVPENHIVIDFDLKDQNGEKSLDRNIEAALKWPKTYAELSKSGSGIHLHYYYDGDPTKLSRVYDEGIEIKVFTGLSSLRRKLTKCINLSIANINTGLPLKEENKMIDFNAVQSERGLRRLILRNLKKKIHPGTKPSMDFIHKILEDAYNSDLKYDVSDMRNQILTFAANSTNQSDYCVDLVTKMKFKSEEPVENIDQNEDDLIVFYDVEVFPNLFVVVYKVAGEGKEPVKLINPTPEEIEELCKFKLIGFNCRRYDNHILYARIMGYNNRQLYKLSQRIVNGDKDAFFREAYNLSYTDIYDFSSKKQSLKKFEIELGIHHMELGLPWDQEVPEEKWELVADYCINDVVATEATFNSRQQDFVAREILADLSGLSVNDTTRMHATKIIFGNERKPKLEYTDLSEMFEGYTYDSGKSDYRGEDPGEGGYVYAEPGIYNNVALLDIASMHPTSILRLNLFGDYTDRFNDILDARLAIKHHDFDKAKNMLGGALEKYLGTPEQADQLAQALKIVINSVYGYTTATFDNPFKDPRNIDNIVAKRGALFMIDLKHAVQEKGFTVAHIKTDSIKIPDATPEIIDFVIEFGEKYGYTFEHEATYDRMCLINQAVYIAKYKDGGWTATGTQFQIPYVFKTLFSKEPIEFEDMCETKSVTSSLYLDFNEDLSEDEHDYRFVGRVGQFCPIKKGKGGALLVREKDGKYYAATGTKGYRWMESEIVKQLGKEKDIDKSYYKKLVDDAIEEISKYGDFEAFTSDNN